MAGYYDNAAVTTFTCVDSHPDTLHGGSKSKEGSLFYLVEGTFEGISFSVSSDVKYSVFFGNCICSKNTSETGTSQLNHVILNEAG